MTDEPNVEQGLCGRCVHRRLLRSRRSVFVRCSLAVQDSRFPRYPALPVLACGGFRPAPAGPAEESHPTVRQGVPPAGDADGD